MLGIVEVTTQQPDASTGSTSSSWATLVLAAATALTYMVWLGWDRQRDVNPVTQESSGPYEAWQVIGVAVVLALIAGMAAWVGHPIVGVVVTTLVFTLCWSVGAATDPHVVGANLWPIGAVAVLAGCLSGTAVVAVVVHAIRSKTAWTSVSPLSRYRQ